MQAVGLQTHIWNNNLKSIVLLAGFPVLLILLLYGLNLLWLGLAGTTDPADGFEIAAQRVATSWPYALISAGLWFVIAWALNQKMIEAATGAKGVTRKQEPRLYNMLENLCISRGLSMPKLAIIESAQLNAFASGIDEKTYTVTLTRGLIDKLDADELEAVIAHELTHIINKDVRLLIVSVIFVGIFSFVGEILFRNMFRIGLRTSGASTGRRGDSRGGGILIIAAVIIIALAYGLALVIRFMLSRKREYLADAGAVELTKNPDAMISALRKISGRSRVEAPNDVQQMMIDNDVSFMGVFATHPSIDKRVKALQAYAGGHDSFA
ncbi:MAG: M48 family metallopeptidase [Pseudomonadota bacterium]